MAKLNSQQLLSQSAVSHDPSENMLNAGLLLKKHFLLSMLKTVVLLHIFMKTDTFFLQDSLIRELFQIEIILNYFLSDKNS